MKIEYIVSKCEMREGNVWTLSSETFKTVEDAIAYHRQQKDGHFSWWEIRVTYSEE